MKLVEIQWQPADRQLRQFGLITLVALPLVSWLWGGSPRVIAAMALAGCLVAVIGVLWPQRLKYLFVGLSVVAMPIGLVVGEMAMLLIFFGVFLPTGIVFRLISRDSLQLRSGGDRTSYWEDKPQPASLKSYFRPW
jgi:hypothetical protein